MKTKAGRASALLGVLLATVPAASFTFITDSRTTGALPIKWSPGTVAVQTKLGSNAAGTSNYDAAVQAAAKDWNAILGNLQIVTTVAAPGAAAQGNGINEVVFADKAFDTTFEAQTLAVTTTWSIGNERTQADIIFNTAYQPWGVYDGARQTNVDLRRVALHELGHLLGLDHPDTATPPQTVSAIMNSRVSNLDRLSSDDIAGAQQLYGPPGTPGNDTFANATAVTLGAGNTAIATGYNTNATRETGEPTHTDTSVTPSRLYRGGRSVWWKWTAPAAGSLTVDTRGSYFDTTLGVYTGTAVAALTEIAFSDDLQNDATAHIQASRATFTATSGLTYYFLVDGFNDGGGAESAGVTLNLSFTPSTTPLPTITSQPTSVSVTTGGTASFTVTASNATSYQWSLANSPIAGATSATYSVSNAQPANAGSYFVTVTNSGGSIVSNTVTLTVTTPTVTPTPTPAPTSSGGGGGGGGAPSPWFAGALSLLVVARWLRRR